MTPTQILGLVGVWFVFSMARIGLTFKLAQHRIDHPPPGHALAFNSAAAADRLDPANYDSRGRRVLPWYRVVSKTYWVVAASALGWIVLHT